MTVAYSRSEVVLSTDPARMVREPFRVISVPWPDESTVKEVVRYLGHVRVPSRPQRDWHRAFGADT